MLGRDPYCRGKGGQGTVVFEESNREAENCLDWRERLESVCYTGEWSTSGASQSHPPCAGWEGWWGRGAGGWLLLQPGAPPEKEVKAAGFLRVRVQAWPSCPLMG